MDISNSDAQPEVEFNPYTAPPEEVTNYRRLISDLNPSDVELIRRGYLSHETSVKAVGGLMYFFGLLLVILAIAQAFGNNREAADGQSRVMADVVAFLMLGLLHFAVGNGLRQLQTWARWMELVVASLYTLVGLFQVNIFGLVFLVVMYLMITKKSGVVFSPRYREIVAQTPQIKYRMSPFFRCRVLNRTQVLLNLAVSESIGHDQFGRDHLHRCLGIDSRELLVFLERGEPGLCFHDILG